MTTPQTPPADAVARLTKLVPQLRQVMMREDADALESLLAAYADAARDRERLDWLERNTRVTESHEYPWPEAYRDESHSTLRAAIDAARIGEAR